MGVRAIVVLGLCLSVAGCRGPSNDSLLERTAAHARANGRGKTSLIATDYPLVEADSLDGALAEYAALTFTVSDRLTLVSDDRIYTWYRLAVSRELSKGRSGLMVNCDLQIPSAIAPRKGERALRLLAGSVDVGGVAIDMVSFQSSIRLADTQQYLILGRLCGAAMIQLPLGASGIFLIDASTGRLAATSPRPHPCVAELLARAGTLPVLEARLSGVTPPPGERSGGWRPRALARSP